MSVTLLIAATIVVISLANRRSTSSEPPVILTEQGKAKTNESNLNNRNDNPPSNSGTVIENKNTETTNTQSGNERATQDLRSLEKYAGQYAGDMFKKEAGLKQRLATLLGSNYKLFMERWDVTSPIEKKGGVLFAEGCMAHSCTIEQSLMAIDTSQGTISCAILSDSFGGQFKTFSEANGSVPSVMKNRMQEIMSEK